MTFHLISIVWAIISFTLLVFSWQFARQGKINLHRSLMLFLAAGAWIFIASYLIQRPYSTELESFPREYVPWIAFHGSMGLVLLIGATNLILSRLRRRDDGQQSHLNRYHKIYGRCLMVLWLFSHLGGIFNVIILA